MGARVLYVGPSEEAYNLVHRLLVAHKLAVAWAKDTQEGVDATLRDTFDVVLVDIDPLGEEGWAVARALRISTRVNATPIVALVPVALSGDAEKSRAAGCSGEIVKPIAAATFPAQVERYLPERIRGATAP